jgi:hypothetical protein
LERIDFIIKIEKYQLPEGKISNVENEACIDFKNVQTRKYRIDRHDMSEILLKVALNTITVIVSKIIPIDCRSVVFSGYSDFFHQ